MRLLGLVSGREFDQRLSQLHQKLGEIAEKIENQSNSVNLKLEEMAKQLSSLNLKLEGIEGINLKLEGMAKQLSETAAAEPLFGERTYRLFHADQEQKLVRAFPGNIFNRDKASNNPAFVELLKLANGDVVAEGAWERVLAETLVEASSVPGAAQVFERQAYVENYLSGLASKFRARYAAGWVDVEDALFLYWLVRLTKPRSIMQCGAFNGRSSAFMMLALAKNGGEGTLNIIDQPPIFDPQDPEWTIEGKLYGAVVPAGKTSGWMVPDQYRDRLQVWNGKVTSLLPKVVDNLEAIDLFCHASDHKYQHMMSAFDEVKRKLRQGGLLVAVDVGWNASLWDFADRCGVPSYTFKSAVGVAFF